MDNKKILLIDDDLAIHTIVKSIGPELGLGVVMVARGEEGLKMALSSTFSVALLDLGLPDIGGLAILKQLRERQPALPILLLTSRTAEVDRVLGLEIGADDYLTKPFSVRELVARVRSLLRRKRAYELSVTGVEGDSSEVLRIADLVLDFQRRTLHVLGRHIELSALEFDIVAYLAKHRGRVVSRDELLTEVWGYTPNATSGYESTVSTNLSRVRTKLEPKPEAPQYILTVRGVGYRFVEGSATPEDGK